MGMRLWGHSSSSGRADAGTFDPGDPRPTRFVVERTETVGAYVVAQILYPDARNYEGRKVLLYRCTAVELRLAKSLDPHFSDKRDKFSPIARFVPTDAGWDLALNAARILMENEP